jgi:hypothetical protein
MIVAMLTLLALEPSQSVPTLPNELEFCQEVAPYDLANCIEALNFQAGRFGIFQCETTIENGSPKVTCHDAGSKGKGGAEKAPR